MSTDTKPRPALPSGRLRDDTEIDDALARATHEDTMAREAVPWLCAVLGVRPGHPQATRLLRGHLEALGDPDASARATEFATKAQLDHPVLRRAAAAIEARQPAAAATELRALLADFPDDPVALRLLANAAVQAGQPQEAIGLLTRALATAPDYVDARRNLVDAYQGDGRFGDALVELDALIARDPATFDYRAVKASTLKRMRRLDEALALYDTLVAERPDHAELLIDRGNAERAAGRADDAIASYRAATAAAPNSGRAWLSLADLKTVRLDAADIASLEGALAADDLAPAQRTALHFALARGLEQAGRHRESFAHYASANALHRLTEPYDPRVVEAHVRRTIALVKAASNPPAIRPPVAGSPTPIFVVGMPRSGSTLIERILAAHPRIEATEELPYLRAIANDLARGGGYPESIAKLPPAELDRIRDRYLGEARAHCRHGADFFVDKAPANWQHIPMIAAVFPEARIVDARRDAMDCGFSNYTQRFGRGHEFAYSLDGIGHHYRQYVATMAAIDAAWPGRVHRIDHEALIAAPEAEMRTLLDYVGVEFDPACLAFHESAEPVFSASSEQVRRPLNDEGIGRWRPFAQWLGPLERALAG